MEKEKRQEPTTSKPWEISVLMALGAGLVMALVLMLFVQQATIARHEVRIDSLEDTLDVRLTSFEEKTDEVIELIHSVGYERQRARPFVEATNGED